MKPLKFKRKSKNDILVERNIKAITTMHKNNKARPKSATFNS